MKNLIKIESDCFDICSRLKDVDPTYQVFFNLNRNCFEVHSYSQTKSSYCFTIPFDQLDERTIDYAQRTMVENKDKIIKEIEEHNKRVEEKNLKMQVNALKELICR